MQPKVLSKLIKLADQKINELLQNRTEMEDNIAALEERMAASITELNDESAIATDDPTGAGRDFMVYSQEMLLRIQNNQNEIHEIEAQIEAMQTEIFEMYAEKSKYQKLLEQHEVKAKKAEKKRETTELDEVARNSESQY